MDSVFSMKKEPRTEAVGDPSTEHLTKKKHQIQFSNLEAKLEETPPTLTLSSPNLKKKRWPSPRSLNSSHPTLANHPSNLDHWLAQWHRLHQPPLSPTAWWPKPWELEYPKEETLLALKESSGCFSPHTTIEVVEVKMTPTQVEEAAEEADLIRQAAEMQPTKGHYQTR